MWFQNVHKKNSLGNIEAKWLIFVTVLHIGLEWRVKAMRVVEWHVSKFLPNMRLMIYIHLLEMDL